MLLLLPTSPWYGLPTCRTKLVLTMKFNSIGQSLLRERRLVQVQRTYQSITIGVPKNGTGRVETNIARDPRDRLRMSVCGFHSNRHCLDFGINHLTVVKLNNSKWDANPYERSPFVWVLASFGDCQQADNGILIEIQHHETHSWKAHRKYVKRIAWKSLWCKSLQTSRFLQKLLHSVAFLLP